MWSLELKALGQLEAARRSRTKRHRASLKTSAAPRRCCATAIRMVASRRPLQRSRLQSVLRSSSLSALQQVAGHCPRSAESLLRDGHYNGRVSAAVTTVAPTISLLTWVKCPASMLRDGHYNGRVSAAVTTVHMQSFRRGHRLPRVVAARRPLQWSRLGGRYNGAPTISLALK